MVSILLHWLPTLLYMAVIFYLSSIPGRDIQAPVSDVVLHLGEYFILTLLVLFSLGQGLFRRVPGKIYLFAFAIAFFYGLSDEFHQSFTPERQPSLKDLAVDGAAALLALGFHHVVSKNRRV